jgi:hypothetical protein
MDYADFQPALFAATVMNAFERPWCITGGWAIDLWLQRLTRAHAGARVAIFRDDQIALRDYLGPRWRLLLAPQNPAARPTSWPNERQMLMLPVQRISAVPPHGSPFEVLLHESDSVDWIYPNEPAVRWPRAQWSVRGAFGVPALAPHLVLLLKSADTRPKDTLDLRSAVPELPPELRAWLYEIIAGKHADHPWLQRLRDA